LLLAAVALAAYLATRGLPLLWAMVVFVALWVSAYAGIVALAQWYRWNYAELTPLAGKTCRAKDKNAEQGAVADGGRDTGSS
jgi:hypothetical protein